MKTAALLSIGAALGVLAAPAEKAMEIKMTRKDAGYSHHHRSDSGVLPERLGRSLYWFGEFDVGESKNLSLLFDTGSINLLVNPHKYKPSALGKKKFPGPKHFQTGYEGVNRAGFGLEALNGTWHLDSVSGAGLLVPNQTVGSITSFKYYDVPPLPTAIEGDGIIGFAGQGLSYSDIKFNSWFFNLCIFKSISSCTLGLAYGTSGKGMAMIGKTAKRLIQGSLVTVPMIQGGYVAQGDVYVNGELMFQTQNFTMDEGTDNIQSPVNNAAAIFKKLGYPTRLQTGSGEPFTSTPIKVLEGYFPCNKPPTLGFAFPPKAHLKKGEKSTIFNVSTSTGIWDVYNHGHNNCTSIIGGTNGVGPGTWLLGQPFFAGHYVEFNNDAKTMGYGNLKNPVNPA